MRQVIIDASGELAIDDVPEPEVDAGGVLVDTHYTLVSPGTELALIEGSWRSLSPDGSGWALGYSVGGVVRARGERGPEVELGDAVACAGYGYARHADVVSVPRHLVSRVPAGVDLRAACFTTLGATAMHAVRQSRATLGEVVVVIGAGVVGQLAAQIARAAGARTVVADLIPERVRLARELGAERGVSGGLEELRDAVLEVSGGIGADAVLLSTSGPSGPSSGSVPSPIDVAMEVSRDRGRVVVVGAESLHVQRGPFFAKELTFTVARAYGPGRYDEQYEVQGIDYPIGYVRWTEHRNMDEFLRLVSEQSVRVLPLITHELPADRAADAYDLLRTQPQHALGVLLRFAAA